MLTINYQGGLKHVTQDVYNFSRLLCIVQLGAKVAKHAGTYLDLFGCLLNYFFARLVFFGIVVGGTAFVRRILVGACIRVATVV